MDEERIAGWVARINRSALGTLGATVRELQRVVGDQRSSFAQLSEVVLRDAALSARLLKIANSPAYAVSAEAVTTVARAATLLGFDTVRSICITSRLLDTLIGAGGLAPDVAGRLLDRIAITLHAATQARMMMGGAAERTREEVFLAAVLGGSARAPSGARRTRRWRHCMRPCRPAMARTRRQSTTWWAAPSPR
ncbi:MAG: HDOD domain-containing protein [Gammaproteobacteria bacterium]|nr:HDOD domain-containing protein [Gammaproteobacteria bacterium]